MTKPDTTAAESPIFVSVAQAAHLLNLKPWSVYQLLDAKQLASGKHGKRRLVSRASVEAYAQKLLDEGSAA